MSVPTGPVVSIAQAFDRMRAIEASLPPADGVACFNRMYLEVTRDDPAVRGLCLTTLATLTAMAGQLLLVAA